ncbi:hypothetical protein IAR50_007437 [Cryptococcus sp. DSM 104548]
MIVIVLPHHDTDLLHPLDSTVVQPYKNWHRNVVSEAACQSRGYPDLAEFLTALEEFRTKAFEREAITRAFETTGLVPYNPGMVLRRLHGYRPGDELSDSDERAANATRRRNRTPSPEPPDTPVSVSPNYVPPTPRSAHALARMAPKLELDSPLTPAQKENVFQELLQRRHVLCKSRRAGQALSGGCTSREASWRREEAQRK